MNITKYVMTADGRFCLCSKYTGLYHDELAGRALALFYSNKSWGEGTTAGFLDFHNGKLQAYGCSESMSLECGPDDGEKIFLAIETGQVRIEEDDYGRIWASNHPAAEGEVANIELLEKFRIIGG